MVSCETNTTDQTRHCSIFIPGSSSSVAVVSLCHLIIHAILSNQFQYCLVVLLKIVVEDQTHPGPILDLRSLNSRTLIHEHQFHSITDKTKRKDKLQG